MKLHPQGDVWVTSIQGYWTGTGANLMNLWFFLKQTFVHFAAFSAPGPFQHSHPLQFSADFPCPPQSPRGHRVDPDLGLGVMGGAGAVCHRAQASCDGL